MDACFHQTKADPCPGECMLAGFRFSKHKVDLEKASLTLNWSTLRLMPQSRQSNRVYLPCALDRECSPAGHAHSGSALDIESICGWTIN